MSLLVPNDNFAVVTPPILPTASSEGETDPAPSLPENDFSYNSVPFTIVGKVKVRYSRGEDSKPIPYPIEAE